MWARELCKELLILGFCAAILVLLGMSLERRRNIDSDRQLSVAANEIITLRAENRNLKKLLEAK